MNDIVMHPLKPVDFSLGQDVIVECTGCLDRRVVEAKLLLLQPPIRYQQDDQSGDQCNYFVSDAQRLS